jgi:hypothetical protein
MKKENCEACGKVIGKNYAVKYPIVPDEVAKQNNIHDSRTIRICLECARGLPAWYSKTVSNVTYNNKTQHFRYKAPDELIEEYESAFRNYAHFRRRKET